MTARDSLRSCSTIWRFCCCLNAIYWGSALYGVDSFSIEVPRHSFPKQQQSNSDTLLLRTRKSNKTNTTKDKESTRVIPHGARTIEESHCPLACQNGSICVRREKQTKDNSMSKSSNNKTQQHYDDEAIAWKCTCPPGFEGTLCELSQNSRPRQRVVTLFVPCGNLICLNGGQCFGGPDFVPHQEGHGSSTGVELCDCSSAVVQNATSETGLTRHVGQTCQYQVQEREYCHRNSDEYCVNGGQCRNMAHDFDQQPCDCPSGYEGRSCQYTTEQVHADCSLSCNNHGACEHGISPYGSSFDDHMTEIKGPHDLLNLPQEQLTRNFMHCACNHGYAGGQCEFEAVQCGDTSTHYCFHGSSCVVDEKGHDACDCSNPQGKKLGGKHCEFEATDHCQDPVRVDSYTAARIFNVHHKLGGASTGNSDNKNSPFCVNNGACYVVEGTEDYYCQCDETKWEGKRCSHRVPKAAPTAAPSSEPTNNTSSSSSPKDSQNRNDMSGYGKFSVILVVGIAFIFVVVIYFRHRLQRQRLRRRMQQSHAMIYPARGGSNFNSPTSFRDRNLHSTGGHGGDNFFDRYLGNTSDDDGGVPSGSSSSKDETIEFYSETEQHEGMTDVEIL